MNYDKFQNSIDGACVATGFRDLDSLTSGWHNSELIMIAARPAMGKTAFGLSMVLNMASRDVPVTLFSLEMSTKMLVTRLASNLCGIPISKIRSNELSDTEKAQLTDGIRKLQDMPLYIDDTGALSVAELREKARSLVREHGVKLIVIDYLQLIYGDGKFGSCEQELNSVLNSLKEMAAELEIPVIALASISKKKSDRDRKDWCPTLSDLSETGSIEQLANTICFIHRPGYYQVEEGSNDNGKALLIVAKSQSSRTGTVEMTFRPEYVRFENLLEKCEPSLHQ